MLNQFGEALVHARGVEHDSDLQHLIGAHIDDPFPAFLKNGAAVDPTKIGRAAPDPAGDGRLMLAVSDDPEMPVADDRPAKRRRTKMRPDDGEDKAGSKRKTKAKSALSNAPAYTKPAKTKPAHTPPVSAKRAQRAAAVRDSKQPICFGPPSDEHRYFARVSLAEAELVTPDTGKPFLRLQKSIGGDTPVTLRVEGMGFDLREDGTAMVRVLAIKLRRFPEGGQDFFFRCRMMGRATEMTHLIDFVEDRQVGDCSPDTSLFTEDSRGAILITNLAKQKVPA